MALPGERLASLIGRGSYGTPFFVGNYYTSVPDASGTLHLAINDDVRPGRLTDNRGAVVVLIWYCQ